MATVAGVLKRLSEANDRAEFMHVWNGYSLKAAKHDKEIEKALYEIKDITMIWKRGRRIIWR